MGYNSPMAKVKVTTVGNSACIVLSKELLEKLRISKGDTLTVTETTRGLELTPYDDRKSRQMEVAEKIMRENRNMLKKLAE